MELDAAQREALVLVTALVTTLGASNVSEGRAVVFAPDLAEVFVEELIVDPCAHFMIASASASRRALL